MFRTKPGNRPKTKIERAKLYILLILLYLLACGTTAVMIRMDILSFLSDDSLITDYGVDPPIPGTGPTVTIRSPVEIIPLPDDLQSITEIRSVEISTIIAFRNDTGEANLTYEIFFHEEETGIFSTPAVVDRTLNLTADSDITHETVIDGDDRILSLFNGNEIAIAAEVVVVPGGGSENISGQVELIDFTVVILAAGERK